MWSKTQDYHEKNYGSKPLHTIVHPKRITMHRKFLEYATLDPFSEVRSDGKIRKRRSVDAKQAAEHLNPSKMTADGGHLVYYELNGMDSESYLHKAVLKLRRNYKLVSKNFIVEERGKGGKLMKRHNMVHDCHYTGVVENHEGFSKVAMSLCNGLVIFVFILVNMIICTVSKIPVTYYQKVQIIPVNVFFYNKN